MKKETIYNKIKELTKNNNHTEARIEIAKELFGDKENNRYLKLFNAIKTISELEGTLPRGVENYRHTLTDNMLTAIETHFGKEITFKIYQCI